MYILQDDLGIMSMGSLKGCTEAVIGWLCSADAEDTYSEDEILEAIDGFKLAFENDSGSENLGFKIFDTEEAA